MIAAVAAVAAACAPAATPDSGSSDVTTEEHPEAVTIELRGEQGRVQRCAGTLLSANVVLTAAHCADGSTSASVSAPATRARAAVADVYTYSWVAKEPAAAKRLMDDVALLVLRSSIPLARYPSVLGTRCSTCAVAHVGWKESGGSLRVTTSSTLHVAREAPRDYPMNRFVATKTGVPSGRAFYLAGQDRDVIVGVSVGTGAKSGGGYVAPLQDVVLRRWITETIAAAATRSAKTSTAKATTKAIHPLDDEVLLDGDGAPTGNATGEEPAGGELTDVPIGGGAAVPIGDESAGIVGPPVEPPAVAAPEVAAPVADDAPRSEVPSGEATAPAGADAVAPAEEIEPAQEPIVDVRGAVGSAEPAAEPYDTMNPDTVRGAIPGTAPLRQVRGDPPETLTRHPSGNSITVADPTDNAFRDDEAIARRYDGVANLYNSHGTPGTLLGPVPAEDVQRLLRDDKPLIVASCFSGAAVEGGSTIRRMASSYGDSPDVASRIYGCTGWASASAANGVDCSGVWVDGNARAVPASERTRLGLNQMQCNVNQIVERNGQRAPDWQDCVRR